MDFKRLFFFDYFTHVNKKKIILITDEILAKNSIDVNKDVNLICHNNTPF